MKKVILILLAISVNTLLFSCTADDLEDSIALQESETVATGDEDGQTPNGE